MGVMRWITSLILILSVPLAADQPQRLVPVDQGVGDLDRLGTSLRDTQGGLRTSGEQTSLYQVVPGDAEGWSDANAPVYYRLAPGFRARVDRIDYLVVDRQGELATNVQPHQDGAFIELIPPNTVFELGPRLQAGFAQPQAIDPRADARVGLPIDARIDLRVRPQAGPAWGSPSYALPVAPSWSVPGHPTH